MASSGRAYTAAGPNATARTAEVGGRRRGRGFGFVDTAEGEVYVYRHSVIGAFDAIDPGGDDP
jgi:hypothetical protein